MKNNYYGCVALLLTLVVQCSHAAIYQWTDRQGQKHYSSTKPRQGRVTEYELAKSYSYHFVKKVYDGDTIQLSDGRKIRLLGINTPETEHANQVAQAGGDAAKTWLTRQLTGKKVRLEFDQEKQDKYSRYLAHIFTEQGEHINLELVRLGFASINTFPPNLKYVPELLAMEQTAERNNLGIWRYSDYAPKAISELTKKNKQGWQRIYGRVSHLKNTRKNVYLKFSDNFEVGIKKKYLQYFADLNDLKGKKIEVRGWVNRHKQGFSMRVKHPSAMKVW